MGDIHHLDFMHPDDQRLMLAEMSAKLNRETVAIQQQEIERLSTIVRSVTRIIAQNEPYKWKVERILAALGETSRV